MNYVERLQKLSRERYAEEKQKPPKPEVKKEPKPKPAKIKKVRRWWRKPKPAKKTIDWDKIRKYAQ